MRLTALHLVGFKSFADKIELRFGPGVTAIVGPNGSGKSNVVDAVRWVLGEQNSRALRSDRVTQLIFSGTERRKPLGLAQATLVLDNSDQSLPIEYGELQVMRRVYRSGESEFFINGTPCRLRDIQQLLLGTGLGRGGMAVVGQGEIDAILSARPLDRRLLLEETAGTSRYRAQQRHAEQRLARARQDLARVEDLIIELSDRVDTLTQQAQTAARYKEITDLLHQQRAVLAVRDWMRARTRHQEAQQGLSRARQQLKDAQAAAEGAQAALQRQQQTVAEGSRRLQAARQRLQEAESAHGALVHRMQLNDLQWQAAEERRRQAASDLARHRSALEETVKAMENLDHEIAQEKDAVQAAEHRLAAANRALVDFDRHFQADAARGAQLQDELMQLLQSVAEKRNELRQLQQEESSFHVALTQRRSKRRELEAKLRAVQQEKQRAAAEAARAMDVLRQGEQEDQRLAETLHQAREQLNGLTRQVADRRGQIHELEGTRRALERLEATFAGYRPAVRAVLSQKPPIAGLLGTVGQLVDVPEPYELPISVALGGATQFLIMSDEQSVSAAIAFLRRAKAGRATFLSLDAIRPRPWPQEGDELLKAPGVIGRASDLIRYDKTLHGVVHYLLGRIVVVEHLARAQQLARRANPALRIVTMDGDLLTPGGPVTGGYQGTQSVDGTVSRRRELRRLSQRLQTLGAELAQFEEEVQRVSEQIETTETHISARRSAMTEAAIERAKNHERALQVAAEQQRLQAALRQLETEDADQAARQQHVADRMVAVRKGLADAEAKAAALRAALDHAGNDAARAESERRRLADNVAEQRAALAARHERLRGWQQRRDDAQQRLEQAKADVQRLVDLERRTRVEGEQLRRELDKDQAALPPLAQRVEEAKAAVTATEEEARREQARLDALVEEARRLSESVARAKEDVWAAETVAARHESAMESHAQRLQELRVRLDDAEHMAEKPIGERVDVRALEEELESLGPVHLGAQEELQEVEERLAFLQTQQQDLEQASASLEEIIARLDKVSDRRFKETMAQVGQQFDVIFRRLFGGGRGELVLAEEDDGVDVHVQMPGKRRQNLMALSGGERALTAIALLFALLQVQPSPFYVLDEIDSALDEANLVRFQTLLKEAAQEAQFVVITHRATTMEVADTLYGVTAAEPGVSTVISLDLQAAMATIA